MRYSSFLQCTNPPQVTLVVVVVVMMILGQIVLPVPPPSVRWVCRLTVKFNRYLLTYSGTTTKKTNASLYTLCSFLFLLEHQPHHRTYRHKLVAARAHAQTATFEATCFSVGRRTPSRAGLPERGSLGSHSSRHSKFKSLCWRRRSSLRWILLNSHIDQCNYLMLFVSLPRLHFVV